MAAVCRVVTASSRRRTRTPIRHVGAESTGETMSESQYVPSPTRWVRRQVETIEATGDTRSVSVLNRPVVMLTMRGAKTGAVRKVPLMRVEHDGVYAAVASKGGAPDTRSGTRTCRPTRASRSRTAPTPGRLSRARSPGPSVSSGGSVASRRTRPTPTTRPRPTASSRCSSSSPHRPDRIGPSRNGGRIAGNVPGRRERAGRPGTGPRRLAGLGPGRRSRTGSPGASERTRESGSVRGRGRRGGGRGVAGGCLPPRPHARRGGNQSRPRTGSTSGTNP